MNRNIFTFSKLIKITFLLTALAFSNFFSGSYSKVISLKTKNISESNSQKKNRKIFKSAKNVLLAEIHWNKEKPENKSKKIYWEKFEEDSNFFGIINNKNNITYENGTLLKSHNRSIMFYDNVIGPDVSWIVPLGFSWNKKYKFDFNIRGHNTVIPDPPKRNFFGWNDGDAVGLLSYQFLNNRNSTFGLNLGFRSVYQGGSSIGGSTSIGEGLSTGFRWDYALSPTSGFAFGAEQLIHFDNLTDTGRNIYITTSKGWWNSEKDGKGKFPLYVATAGLGTGRMAVGNIKGFCSDSLGGSGTDFQKSNLCWAPIFSLAKVWNEKYSTYFEYNSRFFLLGSSLVPIKNFPIRGNLGLILSDHIDNYKLHDGSELNWVFNISLGF